MARIRYSKWARTNGVYRKFLYVLVFKHEPLIKVGWCIDMAQRASDLSKDLSFKNPAGMFYRNEDVFNFEASHVFSAENNDLIVGMEFTIKNSFKEYRQKPDQERLVHWCGDTHLHTEIFNSSILPRVLDIINGAAFVAISNTPELWEWSLKDRRVIGDGKDIPYKAQHPLRERHDWRTDEELDELAKLEADGGGPKKSTFIGPRPSERMDLQRDLTDVGRYLTTAEDGSLELWVVPRDGRQDIRMTVCSFTSVESAYIWVFGTDDVWKVRERRRKLEEKKRSLVAHIRSQPEKFSKSVIDKILGDASALV